MDSPRYTAS